MLLEPSGFGSPFLAGDSDNGGGKVLGSLLRWVVAHTG